MAFYSETERLTVAIAGTYNIIADQGATFNRVVTYNDSNGVPVNLTGYTAKMQIRPTPGASELAVELSTVNGRITLGGSAGTVTLNVAAADMEFSAGQYAYDLELTSGSGVVTRVLMGTFLLRGEVTK